MKNLKLCLGICAGLVLTVLSSDSHAQNIYMGNFIKSLGSGPNYSYSLVEYNGSQYFLQTPNPVAGLTSQDLLLGTMHDIGFPQFGGTLPPELGPNFMQYVNAAGELQTGVAGTYVDGMTLQDIITAYQTAAATGAPLASDVPIISQATIDTLVSVGNSYQSMLGQSPIYGSSNILIDVNGTPYIQAFYTGEAGTLQSAQASLQQVLTYQSTSGSTVASGTFDAVNGSMVIGDAAGDAISASAADAILTAAAPSLAADVTSAVANGLVGLAPGILAQLEIQGIVYLVNQDAQALYQQGGVIDQMIASQPGASSMDPADQLQLAMQLLGSGVALSPVYSEPYGINVISQSASYTDPSSYLNTLSVVTGNTVVSPYASLGLPNAIAGETPYFSPYETMSVAGDGTITVQTANGTTVVQVPIPVATAPDALGNEQPVYAVTQTNPDGSVANYIQSAAFGVADASNTIVTVPGGSITVLAGENTTLDTTDETIDTMLDTNDDIVVAPPNAQMQLQQGAATGACSPGTKQTTVQAAPGINLTFNTPYFCLSNYVPPQNPPGGAGPPPAVTNSNSGGASSGGASGASYNNSGDTSFGTTE